MTSRAKDSFRSACSMAAPPYLMTRVLPWKARMYGRVSIRISARPIIAFTFRLGMLENIAREVFVFDDVGQARVDVAPVDGQLLAGHVGRGERDLFQKLLHDRVEPSGAGILGALVCEGRQLGPRGYRIGRGGEGDTLGG